MNTGNIVIGTTTGTADLTVYSTNTTLGNKVMSIQSTSANTNGATIDFQSNIGAGTYTGLFQLDASGSMIFRTYQTNMYFYAG